MSKFQYQHNGYEYEIEADDEKSADEKFNSTIGKIPKEKSGSQKALEDTTYLEKMKNSPTMGGKIDNALNHVFRYGNRVLEENVPGLKTTKEAISPSLVKGIPIAGRFVPQTEELSEFEKKHPYIAKSLNVAGGTAATLPLAAGASMASGAGFIPQLAGQTAVSAPLNVLDTLAQKGKDITKEDVAKDMTMAVGTSMIPAAATKVFGQTARTIPQDMNSFMKPGGSTLPGGAPKPFPWAVNPASEIPGTAMNGMSPEMIRTLGSLGGGAAGYGLHGIEGMIAGLIGGAPAAHALEPVLRGAGRTMQHPSTQDILRSLMAQSHAHTKDGNVDLPFISNSQQ